MFDFLDKIRLMSLSARRKVAFLVAGTITGGMFLVWLGFGPLGPRSSAVSQEVIGGSTPGPVSVVQLGVSSLWGKLTAQLLSIKDGFSDFGEELMELVSTTTVATTTGQIVTATSTVVHDDSIVIIDSFATTSFRIDP